MSELSPRSRKIVEDALREEGPKDADRDRVRGRLIAQLGAGALAGGAAATAGSASAATSGSAGATAASGAGAAAAGASVASTGLGAAGTLGSAGAGAATGASAGLSAGLVTKLALATTVAGAVGVGAVNVEWKRPTQTADEKTATQQSATQEAVPATRPQPPVEQRLPEVVEEQPPLLEEPDDTPGVADQKSLTPKAARSAESLGLPTETARDRLDAELDLLRTAQNALQQGDPKQALIALDMHARLFPRGAMRQEREAARAVSLCEMGRLNQGREVARRLLAESPRSPLAQRMKRSCALIPP
jgi:hypothetical protein